MDSLMGLSSTVSLANKSTRRHFCRLVEFCSPYCQKLQHFDFCSIELKCSFSEHFVLYEKGITAFLLKSSIYWRLSRSNELHAVCQLFLSIKSNDNRVIKMTDC